MSEPRYNDLMVRREVIFSAWMERVEKAQEERRGSPSFYGTGVVLEKDGTLRISAFSRSTGQGLFDLRIKPFSHEVEVVTA